MPAEGSGKATTRGVQRRFQARIEPKGPAGAWSKIRIPFQADRVFASRARVPVKGTMNGIAFKASLFREGDGTHDQGDEKAPCPAEENRVCGGWGKASTTTCMDSSQEPRLSHHAPICTSTNRCAGRPAFSRGRSWP